VLTITRDLRLALAEFNAGTTAARRAYNADVHRVCPACQMRRLDAAHNTCHHCRKSKP